MYLFEQNPVVFDSQFKSSYIQYQGTDLQYNAKPVRPNQFRSLVKYRMPQTRDTLDARQTVLAQGRLTRQHSQAVSSILGLAGPKQHKIDTVGLELFAKEGLMY